MNGQKIIFVVGVEHSGTTVLYRMLARHPDIAWFSQYSMRGGQIPGRIRLPFYKIFNRLGRKFFQIPWKKRHGWKRKYSNRPGFLPTPTEPHKVWDYLLSTQDVPSQFFAESDVHDKAVLRMRLTCFEELHAWKKKCLLIKLPRLTRAVELLARAFPEALFLHIVRDGKAVALSNAHKFARHGESREESLQKSALYWNEVMMYLEASQRKLGERLFTIRYEDLCHDVHGTLHRVVEWAGMQYAESFCALPKTLHITDEKWFSTLQSGEKQILDSVLEHSAVSHLYRSGLAQ